jgi:hypothetical protein
LTVCGIGTAKILHERAQVTYPYQSVFLKFYGLLVNTAKDILNWLSGSHTLRKKLEIF